jgi:hypothetical protein
MKGGRKDSPSVVRQVAYVEEELVGRMNPSTYRMQQTWDRGWVVVGVGSGSQPASCVG